MKTQAASAALRRSSVSSSPADDVDTPETKEAERSPTTGTQSDQFEAENRSGAGWAEQGQRLLRSGLTALPGGLGQLSQLAPRRGIGSAGSATAREAERLESMLAEARRSGEPLSPEARAEVMQTLDGWQSRLGKSDLRDDVEKGLREAFIDSGLRDKMIEGAVTGALDAWDGLDKTQQKQAKELAKQLKSLTGEGGIGGEEGLFVKAMGSTERGRALVAMHRGLDELTQAKGDKIDFEMIDKMAQTFRKVGGSVLTDFALENHYLTDIHLKRPDPANARVGTALAMGLARDPQFAEYAADNYHQAGRRTAMSLHASGRAFAVEALGRDITDPARFDSLPDDVKATLDEFSDYSVSSMLAQAAFSDPNDAIRERAAEVQADAVGLGPALPEIGFPYDRER